MNTAINLNLSRDELDGRMDCFGEFEENDAICLNSCALNINCAIAKDKLLGFQLMSDSSFSFDRFNVFETE
ncbi:MAG: hypothetical protein AMR96_06925 [Candidatus Adiutrix intracellularis]|jgi:hypothetical protein|nr:MAG: hypothetical protein AMR96_06925 [Candidatus Adiutrix intracellularis]MDR2827184.1 hypothetical protein [Candidatus Adiutrix intracellularis]